MKKEEVVLAKKILSTPKQIAIIPHKNPDGDAVGSTLGLAAYLTKKGHKVDVICPNDFPDFLKWMPNIHFITYYDSQNRQSKAIIEKADLIFTLDFNDLSRVDEMQSVLKESNADFIMIDHHQKPSDYAVITYSDISMSSTCEMVYHFIDYLNDLDKIDADIATCLYAGIMTDSGSFRFASTSSTTHKIVADLIDRGAKNSEIHENVYDTNTESRLQLLGCALKNLVILREYNTAYISLSQHELDDAGFKKGDTEGFVNYGLSVNGIRFSAIFIENKNEGFVKVSLRSKGDFSVNEFSRSHFNGGGHTNAAGGRYEKSLAETIVYFTTILKEYKEQLTA